MNTNSVGNRPLSLAVHLEQVARLTGGYAWHHTESCNCGLLARSITGLTGKGLSTIIQNIDVGLPCTWEKMAAATCPLTGEPQEEIFKRLYKAGLRYEDYHDLEFLANVEVKHEMKLSLHRLKYVPYKCQINLSNYCLAWARLIRKYHCAYPLMSRADIMKAEGIIV